MSEEKGGKWGLGLQKLKGAVPSSAVFTFRTFAAPPPRLPVAAHRRAQLPLGEPERRRQRAR
jgi:hypothetical protein